MGFLRAWEKQLVSKTKSGAIIFASVLILGMLILQSCSTSTNAGRQTIPEAITLDKSALGNLSSNSFRTGQQKICSTTNVPISIPDMGALPDTISTSITGVISDLDVSLNILHTYVGDLVITLSQWGGPGPVTLINRLGCGGSNIDVTINDEGQDGNVVSQCEDAPAIYGDRIGGKPAGPVLSTFDGDNFSGKWILTINDNSRGDVGALVAWCLIPTFEKNCFVLKSSHTGQGSDPVASLSNSSGCPVGQYVAGEQVFISGATPDNGWQIGGWTNTNNDNSTESTNTVSMPANDLMTSVNYTEAVPCYALTLSHSGQGSDPIASPTNSTSCSLGQYIAGEHITLSGAVPDSGWQIRNWNNTENDASTDNTNTVTMPANDLTTSVDYYIPECKAGTFLFKGNSTLTGTSGNIIPFLINEINVNVSAWSRDKVTDTYAPAYVGSYSGGLGVTDSFSDKQGANNQHTLDNDGTDNYLLFEFNRPVNLDQIYLGYVVSDSDITAWLGDAPNGIDPYMDHQTLNGELLNTLIAETNLGNTKVHWADINGNNQFGNILVVATKVDDTNDYVKVEKLLLTCPK
jgi:subtilisin-like proprotein convertase family protein